MPGVDPIIYDGSAVDVVQGPPYLNRAALRRSHCRRRAFHHGSERRRPSCRYEVPRVSPRTSA